MMNVMKLPILLTALLLSASPAYSLDYQEEMNKLCSTSERTESACAFLYMNTSLTILCMLKARKMVSQSGIDLFKEIILTDDANSQPGIIQAVNKWKSLGCSL